MNKFILKFIRCYKRPSSESRNRPIRLWPIDLLHRHESKLIGKKKEKKDFSTILIDPLEYPQGKKFSLDSTSPTP